MRQETFTLSQKKLQRVAVISQRVPGNLACAKGKKLWFIGLAHSNEVGCFWRSLCRKGGADKRGLSETSGGLCGLGRGDSLSRQKQRGDPEAAPCAARLQSGSEGDFCD
jgi:hypothetical protein